jgi:hypothetical protein
MHRVGTGAPCSVGLQPFPGSPQEGLAKGRGSEKEGLPPSSEINLAAGSGSIRCRGPGRVGSPEWDYPG